VAFVREVVQETHALLDRFRQERERMATELREMLAKSESLRRKDFNAMMGEILAAQQRREEGVKAMLQKFRGEEERVAEQFQQLLGRGGTLRLKDFKRTLVHLKAAQQRRSQDTAEAVHEQVSVMQEEVQGMLEAFKRERERMREEWARAASVTHAGSAT
jgi:uncharacterized protein YukE